MTSLLIVDDNWEMRQMVKSVVCKSTDEVVECSDGVEALPAYFAHHPDWVLMDVEMKYMDGIRATETIIAEFPDAKVIIVTNHTDAYTRDAASAAGAMAFVSKDNLIELRTLIASGCQVGDAGYQVPGVPSNSGPNSCYLTPDTREATPECQNDES